MPAQKPDGAPWRNLYGRRAGKPLRPGQRAHLTATLPRLQIPEVTWAENPERRPLDLDALFGRRAERVLEIGFGSGEHILARAQAAPERDFLGCEPFVNGVATLVSAIAAQEVGNIRIHPGDARDLLDVLPTASLAAVYLLYPDPWPKAKHHRRRFVQPQTLGPIARVLAPGGRFRLATDIPDYARHSLEAVLPHPAFRWTAARAEDWRTPWPGWPGTRYEAKAQRDGRRPIYLEFRRAERPGGRPGPAPL